MTKEFAPRRLDVKGFAEDGGRLSGERAGAQHRAPDGRNRRDAAADIAGHLVGHRRIAQSRAMCIRKSGCT